MADLSVTGEVVVTSEKAEAAFDRVGDKATQMATEVAGAAGKAGQAVDGIGAGAEKSADKFTRAESRMRDAIKRSTQELQLLGKTASEKLEFNINAKGLDASKFAPYIEELKKAEAAQRIATGSLDKMGISAAQTAAALRGVPAQFTDIITSLQGGQAPLTVFLQQGGQLRDMFGGAGAAARALGGYVVGLINPFTLAAAGAAALAVAYNQGSKEADAYRLAMVGTGNAAGATAGQLKSYAQEISSVVGTQGKAAESLAAFVSTGRVSRDVLKEASQAAIAWERATGQAVGTTAKQFADLGKDPLQAVLKLNEGTNFLTESVYKQIKSLGEQGKTAEAAAVAQRAYADALTGRAGEIERNLGSIETAWNKVKDAAKAGWDAILNVGRAETNQDRLAATRKQIADLENRLAAGSGFAETAGGAATGRPSSANNDRLRAELMGLKAKEAALFGVASAEQAAAESQAERAKQTQAAAEWDKAGAKFLSDKAKLERELTAARNEGLAAGKSQAEIEQRLAQIRDSYKDKGAASAIKAEQTAYASLIATINTKIAQNKEELLYSGRITESDKIRIKVQEELDSGAKKLTASHRAFVLARLALLEMQEREKDLVQANVASYKEQVAMQEELAQAYVAESKAREAGRAAVTSYAAGIQESNDALQFELSLMGMSEQARNTALEQYRIELDLKKQIAAIDANGGFDEAQREEERARARAAAATAKANAANRAFLDDWKRSVSQYDDIFRRGFADMLNNGKDGWKSFTRSLATTFKTTVADQIYKMFAQPFVVRVVGSLMGMIGSNAAAGAAGSGIGSGIATSIGTSAIGSAFSMGLTNFGTGVGSTLANGVFGGIGTNISNFGTLAGAGNWSGALGVAAPYLAGIGALYAIISSLDDSGTYHTGGAAQYSAARGLSAGQSGADYNIGFGRVEAGAETISAVGGVAKGIATALDSVALAFGRTAGYEVAAAFARDTSEDPEWAALRISQGGRDLTNLNDDRASKWAPREVADGDAGWQQFLGIAAQEMRDIVLGMDLSTWAEDMVKSLGDAPSIDQLGTVLAQIAQVQSAFVSLGKSMEMFSGLTDEMQSGLLAAAGSIDALTAGAGAFYQGFYSEQERMDSLSRQVQEALGKLDLSIDPALGDYAKKQFRAAVEAAFAAGDAELAAALLSLSGTFANAADYFEQAADAQAQAAKESADAQIKAAQDAARAIAEAYESAMERIGSTRFDLQNQLLTQSGQGQYAQQLVDQRDLADLTKGLPEEQAAKLREQFEANLKLRDQYEANQLAADNLAAAMGQLKEQQDAATQAQKDMLQSTVTSAKKAVDDLRSIFDFVGDSIKELRGDVVSTAGMQAEQARAFIQRASVLMRSGSVVDSGQLQAAIRTASGSVQTGAYASQFEADNARLLLANELAGLQDGTAGQLTVAEKHLSVAEQQLNALNVIAASINSLASAQAVAAGQPRDQWARVQGQDVYASSGGAVGINTGSGIDIYGKDGSRFTGGEAIAFVRNQLAANEEASVYAAAVRTGISSKALDELMGWAAGTSNDWAKANGLPQFAIGTNYVPRDMVAQIHEGEAIVPKAFNPWANGMTSSNPETERLLQQLVADNRVQAGEIVRLNTRIAKLMERWDGEGLPQARSEAAV